MGTRIFILYPFARPETGRKLSSKTGRTFTTDFCCKKIDNTRTGHSFNSISGKDINWA